MLAEEHVTDLIPAYALGSLEEVEARQVQIHLESCAACRAELVQYRLIVDQLGLGAPDRTPPAALKSKLMGQISRARNHPALDPKPNAFQRLAQALRGLSPAWSLVSLALVVALVASNLFLWQRVTDLENANQDALHTVQLFGTEASPGATGMLVVSRDGEHGTLVVDGLPVLGESQQYQLWLIKDGKRTSGGVFSVDYDGYGSLWISSPQPLASYASFGITIEPAGGSPGPTGKKVLGGDM